MKPTEFPEQTDVLARNQPEYLPLPVWRGGPEGEVVSCWRLSWRERFTLLVTGCVWVRVLTFGDPLQPQVVEARSPFVRSTGEG